MIFKFQFKWFPFLLVFSTLLVINHFVVAQTTVKVLNRENQQPVAFATLLHAASWNAITSDIRGKASISKSGNWIISHASYQSDTIYLNISKKDTINIFLDRKNMQISSVTVNAFLRERRLNTVPGTITRLSGAVLRSNNELLPAQMLNQVPGVYMHEGGPGTSRITIRGIGSRSPYSTSRIKAYLNDIPLTNGSGETSLEDIDMGLLESIDVLPGPAGVPYGAGLAGVVLLSPLINNETSSFAHSATVGSYGLLKNISHLNIAKKSGALSLKVHDTRMEGYRENSDFYRSGILLNGVFQSPGSKFSIQPLLMYTKLKSYIPSSISDSLFRNNPEQAAASWKKTRGNEDYEKILTGTTITYQHDSSLLARGTFFVNFRVADEVRPFDILSENNQMTGFRGFFNKTFEPGKSTYLLSGGVEAFFEWYEYQTYTNIDAVGNRGVLLSNNRENRNYVNAFLQGEWVRGRFSATAGLNVNTTRYQYQDRYARDTLDLSGNYTFNPAISPRFVVDYKVFGEAAMYGVISHGFSPPSLSETLTPDGDINPSIKPESGWNYELGFRGYPFNPALFLNINIYTLQAQNLLVAERIGPDAFIGRNAGETSHTGLEFFGEWQMSEMPFIETNFPRLHVSLYSGYTHAWHYFSDFVSNSIDYSGNRLTGSPINTVNSGIRFHLGGLYGNLLVNYTGEMPMRDDNSLTSEPYSFTNLKAGYRQALYNHFRFDVSFGINNVFDEKYASMILVNAPSFGGSDPRYYYPGLPRNFFLSLKVNYNL